MGDFGIDPKSLSDVFNPNAAQGEILVHDGAAYTGLAIAAAAQILISSGTTLAYKAVSGDITIDANGVVAIAVGAIVNADVNAAAAIVMSKITGTAAQFNTALSDDTFAFISNNLSIFAATTSAQLAGVISDETGTGLLVFGTSPTLITPALGTPASGVMTNMTGLVNAGVDAAAAIATSKLADSANFVLINQTNVFGDFNQDFKDNRIRIFNPANTFAYTIVAAAIVAARNINLPLQTGDITLGDRTTSVIAAAGDETTILSTGTAKVTFRVPFAMTLTEVRATLTTAGTGAALVTVDINEGGTSILSTKITIDATEKTSKTATTPPVISDTALADDAEMTIDIDTVDTDNVATGLKIYLIGYKTP